MRPGRRPRLGPDWPGWQRAARDNGPAGRNDGLRRLDDGEGADDARDRAGCRERLRGLRLIERAAGA